MSTQYPLRFQICFRSLGLFLGSHPINVYQISLGGRERVRRSDFLRSDREGKENKRQIGMNISSGLGKGGLSFSVATPVT